MFDCTVLLQGMSGKRLENTQDCVYEKLDCTSRIFFAFLGLALRMLPILHSTVWLNYRSLSSNILSSALWKCGELPFTCGDGSDIDLKKLNNYAIDMAARQVLNTEDAGRVTQVDL